MKTIRVTQNASGKFPPDTVRLSVEISAQHKKSGEAAKLWQEKRSGLLASLSAAGVKEGEVTTHGTGVSCTRQDGKTVFYAHGDCSLSLKISDERMSDITDALEKGNVAWRQQYVLADNTHRASLIAQAVAAAKEDALSIAAAAGVRLGNLTHVEYAAPYGGGARVMRAMANAETIGVRPEEVELSEGVTCEWEIV